MKFNKKEFPVDSIVYFINRDRNDFRYYPDFGIVDDQWFGKVSVHFLVPKRITKYRSPYFTNATIEDVTEKYSHKRHKLPKGWTFGTKLFEEYYDQDEYDALHKALDNVSIKDPDSIQQAVKDGILVRRDGYENDRVTTDADKNGYWYQVESANGIWSYKEPCDRTMDDSDLYSTYEEAFAEAKARNDELARQAALSDYDWSVEQIDKELARWRLSFGATPQDAVSIREQLLEMKNVENIEVRTDAGGFVWRYAGRNRWNHIAPRNW